MNDLKPLLTVIAGCNGSGKSSFSRALLDSSTRPFDYDIVFKEKYEKLLDSDFRETMAHNQARNELEESIQFAIDSKSDFAYETNFNSTPLYWPSKFRSKNYQVRLVFFCLDKIEEAKRRVQIRVENGGHHVPESEIISRYHLGYENLNKHWRFFDEIFLFNTSDYKSFPRFVLQTSYQRIIYSENVPVFLMDLIPDFFLGPSK